MKKIDFHIHTISTISDSAFEFSVERLNEYIDKRRLDCIAITNHNTFDLDQYNEIYELVPIEVFPGIEIDVEGSHILVIADGNELDDFNEKCQQISKAIPTENDSITVAELISIFIDLSNYIVIPHYDKNPSINDDTLDQLSSFITAGEVASPKKFMYCIKDKERLVPVYFSDCRIATNLTTYPIRQTYLSCNGVSFAAIRNCLRDRNKVSLSANDTNSLFEAFEDGQELSTGLNIIIGERSSGKSFTLNRISRKYENVRYIKQFSLVERDDKEDEKKFNKILSEKHSLLTRDYLEELQNVVNNIIDVDLEDDSNSISRYLDSLIKYAKESEKHDAFSKADLFREEEFQILDQQGLLDLIRSTENLIENFEFKEVIEKHVSLQSLKQLIVELMIEYGKREKERLIKKWLNDLINEIKNKLQIKTAATAPNDIDLYRVAMNLNKVEKFEGVVRLAKKRREIERKTIQGFEVVANSGEFEGAGELKSLSKSRSAFSEAFDEYKSPYKFLQKLKNVDGLEDVDLFKYFVRIEYKILNKDGFEVSGGERSEFNLLQEIQDAQKYDMLLIDEPESSFDNIFLKKEVNEIIKDISSNMPVVIVTHNSTVGASIKPDYLLCTRKEVIDGKIEYRLYSGFPTSKELLSKDGKRLNALDVTMGCLEAGQQAYNERRKGYENLEN